MTARLVSIGSVNLDLQVRSSDPLEPGKTRIVSDFLAAGGGKGANRAFAARQLGVPAQLFASVGDDDFGDRALAGLRRCEVDLSHVARVPGHATGIALIAVAPDGDKVILLAPNANERWSAHAIETLRRELDRVPSGSVVTIDLEVPEPVCLAAAEVARARGLTVVVDPSPASRMPAELYARVDYLTPNPREAEVLSGIEVRDAETGLAAGRALLAQGVGGALVKLPEGGCACVTRAEQQVVLPAEVEVVDKTGAGDAFAGAFSVALLQALEPLEAARWGTAAACLALGCYGSQMDFIDRTRLAHVLARVHVRR